MSLRRPINLRLDRVKFAFFGAVLGQKCARQTQVRGLLCAGWARMPGRGAGITYVDAAPSKTLLHFFSFPFTLVFLRPAEGEGSPREGRAGAGEDRGAPWLCGWAPAFFATVDPVAGGVGPIVKNLESEE